jgi:hypothetical protein
MFVSVGPSATLCARAARGARFIMICIIPAAPGPIFVLAADCCQIVAAYNQRSIFSSVDFLFEEGFSGRARAVHLVVAPK